MPNTREKLIELLCYAHNNATDGAVFENLSYGEQLGVEADHLIANGVTVQKWIPLSEQKPNRDELVLVFFEGMRDTNCAIQVMYGWCMGGSASHWMPLPEPPKGE